MYKHFLVFLAFIFVFACETNHKEKESIEDKIETEKVRTNKKIPKSKENLKSITFEAWIANMQGKNCYIYSFPVSSLGMYIDRSTHYILINDKKEIVVFGGLVYKERSKVRIDLPKYSFFLETLEDKAWANNEDFIISKILEEKNNIMFINNEFKKNDKEEEQSSLDKYTLRGFAEAWDYMLDNCKVNKIKNTETIS